MWEGQPSKHPVSWGRLTPRTAFAAKMGVHRQSLPCTHGITENHGTLNAHSRHGLSRHVEAELARLVGWIAWSGWVGWALLRWLTGLAGLAGLKKIGEAIYI